MISRFSAWVNVVNTTSLRIIASIGGAIFSMTFVLLAMLLRAWEPSAMQFKVLCGMAGVLLTMMGFDVIQFIGKRFSDATYAAAKNPTQPVKVDTPEPPVVAMDSTAPRSYRDVHGEGERGA